MVHAQINEDVRNITSAAMNMFNDTNIVLVQSNLLKYEDSSATRGVSFWKCNSRKYSACQQSLNAHTVPYTAATPQPDDILMKLEEIKASIKSMVAVECRSGRSVEEIITNAQNKSPLWLMRFNVSFATIFLHHQPIYRLAAGKFSVVRAAFYNGQ
ncbi:uncharacterized protein LOC130623563 [Hydractinia symbiolongicarpus]|uniref:uncharacterized protein LOC130623563 n=1 Tax=Hydractinia symbiolongicarpus TaxID=13093 RepID=UPI00254CBF7B|nr:uncharacterized protein LOC130623563 [Hydractinia symbiolongicarpus]